MLIAATLAIHNIPEGLAVCLVLVPRGESCTRASLWAVLTRYVLARARMPHKWRRRVYFFLSLFFLPRGSLTDRRLGVHLLCRPVPSVPQPVMAVLAFIFVEEFHFILPVGLGFAAGAMLWVAVFELLAEALEIIPLVHALVAAGAAGAFMFATHLLVKDSVA